jgi:stage III sporulation protein AG
MDTEKKSVLGKLFGKKTTAILFIIGIAGIALIFISEFIHPASDNSQQAVQTVQNSDIGTYESQTETRLENIIGEINGVGRVKVLVTAERGVENIYEQDNKTTTDKTQQSGGDGSVQTQDNNNTEQSPIIVNNDSGGQQALVKTQIQPQIIGVVVVCDGGDNADVQESVVNAVSTALGLPTNEISIMKMKT